MSPRAVSVFLALTVLLLDSPAGAQDARESLSTADPAQEGFSVQRLGEMEKAIQNGDIAGRVCQGGAFLVFALTGEPRRTAPNELLLPATERPEPRFQASISQRANQGVVSLAFA